MLVGKIIAYIKTGRLLGRFFISEVSSMERDCLKRRMQGLENPRKSQLVSDILDPQQVEQRRALYRECDSQRAWVQIQRRLKERQKRSLFKRYAVALRSAAAIAAAVIICGAVLYTHVGKQQRILSEIAQIRPDGMRATLYLANGEAIDLQKPSREIEGVIVHENSLEYDRTVENPKEAFNTVVTPRGGDYRLTLADGTKVWLNAASQLRYFTSSDVRERRVWLEGEAYFEVAHDAARPFVVTSGGQQIKVFGTCFNVNTYDCGDAICTTLVEGSVSVGATTGGDAVMLRPNEQALFSLGESNPIRVTEVDASQYTAWMDNLFLFNRAPLSEIMARLARWYNFEYEIAPHLNSLYFSGQFQRFESLDKVLTIITAASAYIKIEYDGKKIILE